MGNGLANGGDLNCALLELFAQFGEFGKVAGGGISRLAASEADRQARDFLCHWLEENNCEVVVDRVGNIFGILDLKSGDPDAYFFCGSHLDSQPNGGRFDGTYGVACACITALAVELAVRKEALKPCCRYFVVVCWTGEEGARFQPSLLGSGVFTGEIPARTALIAKDEDGISLGEALSRIDYLGEGEGPHPSHYFEIHIEQGPHLERAGKEVGVVTSCWGARKLRTEITGRPDHTGPTPMDERQDALLAAAHIAVRVNELANTASAPVHGSVGRMEIAPNSPNTVAERVSVWIEFRSGDEAVLQDIERDLISSFTDVEELSGCKIELDSRDRRDVIDFDYAASARVEAVLDEADISHMRLSTIAGHDAIRLQKICPSTLMFVPSRGGISHSPEEFTSEGDMAQGLNAMTCAVANLINSATAHTHHGAVHA